jgi:hypothetical protein
MEFDQKPPYGFDYGKGKEQREGGAQPLFAGGPGMIMPSVVALRGRDRDARRSRVVYSCD